MSLLRTPCGSIGTGVRVNGSIKERFTTGRRRWWRGGVLRRIYKEVIKLRIEQHGKSDTYQIQRSNEASPGDDEVHKKKKRTDTTRLCCWLDE